MAEPLITLPLPTRDLIGESPVWDGREQALYWVDIRGQKVQRWVPGGQAAPGTGHAQSAQPVHTWATPQEVGAIALAAPGRLLLALADGFAWLNLESGAVNAIAPVHHPKPPMRLNDGRTDREGRFVCGSMVLHRGQAPSERDGMLYRLEHDGRVTPLITHLGGSGIGVANATCFAPDGRTLYFGDSLAGVIRAWDYALDGSMSNERVWADTRLEGSPPDGATVDANGCVWVALVLAGKVACYGPDGRLLRVLELPVPYPTCPCFGGADLSTLFVTSLSNSGNRLRSEEPAAGALVQVQGLGVRGLPEVAYQHRA